MSVKYNVVPKKNPQDREAPAKFYPVVNSSGKVNQRNLAQKGSLQSTLSAADLAAAMEILLTLIPQELMAGNIIDLGDFGSFRLSVKAEGSETAEEVTAHNVKSVKVRFTPGKEFKYAMSRVTFEKI